jgi:hypothetical protein
MKIVAKSNYDLDNFSEYVIAESLNSYYGKLIEKLLQDKTTGRDSVWPVLVDDNYELFKWEP